MRIGTQVMTPGGPGELIGWRFDLKIITEILVYHQWRGNPKPPVVHAYRPGEVRPLKTDQPDVTKKENLNGRH